MHMSLRSLGWLVVALHPLFTSAGPVYNAQQEGWISSDLARRSDLVERDNVVVYEPAKRKRKRDIHPGEETILQPIPDDLFGLEKRDALDVSRLDLTPECHMTFGAEHGMLLLLYSSFCFAACLYCSASTDTQNIQARKERLS